jgi:hypothetical protein
MYNLEEDPAERINLVTQEPVLTETLERHLEKHFSELEEKTTAGEEAKIDEWTEQSLKALGYLK